MIESEVIKTPDGDRPWSYVRRALLHYDRIVKRREEESEKRSIASKKGWAKRKAMKK